LTRIVSIQGAPTGCYTVRPNLLKIGVFSRILNLWARVKRVSSLCPVSFFRWTHYSGTYGCVHRKKWLVWRSCNGVRHIKLCYVEPG